MRRALAAVTLMLFAASPALALRERKLSSTAYPDCFKMVDSTDHVTPKTGLTITATCSKNGGSFGACSGSISEISSGIYCIAGNATDRNTLGPLLFHMTGSAADNNDFEIEVRTNDPFISPDTSSVQVANVTQWNSSNVATPNTAGVPKVDVTQFNGSNATSASGRPEVNTTHLAGTTSAGTAGYCAPDWGHVNAPTTTVGLSGTTVGAVTTTTNLTNAPTNGDFTSTMKTSLNNSTPASVTGAVGSVTGSVGSVTGNVGGNVVGSVASVTGAVGSVTGNVGGNVTGSVGNVVGLTASNLDATVSSRASGSALATVQADTDDLQTRLPAALGANGNIKADVRDFRGMASAGAAGYCGLDWSAVNAPTTTQGLTGTTVNTAQVCGTVTGNVDGTVGGVAAGGITASSIAADAIGASELAADAVAEIQNGLATGTNVTTAQNNVLTRLGSPAGASVSADIAALPTAPVIADAVWLATLSDYASFAGSTGEKLGLIPTSGGGATAAEVWDYLTTALTTSGSVGEFLLAKLSLLTSGTRITIADPVQVVAVSIVPGTAYTGVRQPKLTWPLAASERNLTGATPKLVITDGDTPLLTITGTVTGAGTESQAMEFSVTAAQSALLLSIGPTAYTYQINATWVADSPVAPVRLFTGSVDTQARYQ